MAKWRNRDPFVPSATLRSRRDAGLSRTLLLVRDGDHLPNPAEFATAAEQAAPARAASIVSAYTASQIVGGGSRQWSQSLCCPA
jgi:hypothetical protein